jgi:hypothetical protein
MRGSKHYLIFPLFFLTMATGCAPKYIYVVQRDTPIKPVFTVIPSDSTYYSAARLASDTELALIKLGLSVVNPPIRKSVTKKSGVEKEARDASKGKASAEEIKEEFNVFDETNADYVIQIEARNDNFKIVKKDTLEILAVEKARLFSQYQGTSSEWKLYDLFTALGFTVKKPQAER